MSLHVVIIGALASNLYKAGMGVAGFSHDENHNHSPRTKRRDAFAEPNFGMICTLIRLFGSKRDKCLE